MKRETPAAPQLEESEQAREQHVFMVTEAAQLLLREGSPAALFVGGASARWLAICGRL